MTPPSKVPVGVTVQVPTVFRPHAHKSTALLHEKPMVRVADRYVGPPGNPASDYSTMEAVAKALGDERQLFDKGYGEYQDKNNRNEKFLKITMAILYIKKYLRSGDEKDAGVALARIEAWLKDSVLLADTIVGRPVCVSLTNVLRHAPKKGQVPDKGVQDMITALSKCDAVKSGAPVASPAPIAADATDMKAFLAKFNDGALFGGNFSNYDTKRNSDDYLPMTIAILRIREYLKSDGREINVRDSLGRVEDWLNHEVWVNNELKNPISKDARDKLIEALTVAPTRSPAWNSGVQQLLTALRNHPAVALSPMPTPNPVNGSGALSEYTVPLSPASSFKEPVEDTKEILDSRLSSVAGPAFRRVLKVPGSWLRCNMTINVAKTGVISSVSYADIKLSEPTSRGDLQSSLGIMASTLRSQFRFRGFDKDGGDIKTSLTVVKPRN